MPARRRPYDPTKQHIIEANLDVYGCTIFHERWFRATWHEHRTDVAEYFAGRPDDLLTLRACEGEGWRELCAFLGVPVPDCLFPHVNERNHKA